MSQLLMVAYRIEFINGSVKRGSVAVPADTPEAACRAVAGLIRGAGSAKYGRPECFADINPHEVEDVTVSVIGPA